jgi:hypothetical protein
MRGLACVQCKKFLRIVKNGVNIEEGMPTRGDEWGPYKLWKADLYECPECKVQLACGFGQGPIAEHFESDYAKVREQNPPLIRVDDCGGAKP